MMYQITVVLYLPHDWRGGAPVTHGGRQSRGREEDTSTA